ncbi:MAG: phosphoglycerate dehydrogenase [Actinobacteria bacterium]|nr:MAG: phosphoglycerate dehydrogenase [Actinomycetota bacterium]
MGEEAPLRVLVTEPLSEGGQDLLRREFEVDVRPDLAAEGLAEAIAPYAALIVRSQTKVTADVLERAENLRVIGRAGIGLDNVDVETATRRGVMVVNAPQSNIVSAAEHTIALLLAQARNIPQADASIKAGKWERARFQGVELHGKTLGVLGLGRVGTMVAQRAEAFGMRIVAFDPYVSRERARSLGVELMPNLEAVLVQADFVTIHLPLTTETEGLIGERELALMKDGARIVNTSRGGIIDERALVAAVRDGKLGGAALDVFEQEPVPKAHPLLVYESVVATPHLGASTAEAQDKAGATIAEMVRLALRGEFVPYAVNVPAAGDVSEQVRPFLALAEQLGAILTGLAEGPVHGIEAEYVGHLAEHDTRALTLAALKGALARVVHEPVSFVNAGMIARERGIGVSERKAPISRDYVNLMTLRAATEAGEVTVAGTLVGVRGGERLVRIDDFDVDVAPARHMAFFLYVDRPGVIGTVGTLLGDAGINIGSMEVGRTEAGGSALMALTVDSAIPAEVLGRIERAIGAERARSITVPV